MTEQGARALYESLARFQWWRRTLQRAAPGSGLEMRKHLNAPQAEGPSDGRAGLDEWLMHQIDGQPQRILDLGCGFGASLLRWLPQPSHGDEDLRHAFGITPSAYQVRRARQVANQAGDSSRYTFLQQSLEAQLPTEVDVILAIEALGHTSKLSLILQHVRRSLRPSGALVWVEDLLHEPVHQDPDVVALATSWSSPPLRDVATARRELKDAGLEVTAEWDLTPQVPHRELAVIERSHVTATRWRRWLPLPFARRVAQAFVGGFVLERLYARGLASYRVLLARPSKATS